MAALTITLLIVSVLAALATYWASIRLGLGPVIGSALISFLASFPLYLFPNALEFILPGLTALAPVIVIGSSFTAMSSEQLMPGYKRMTIAGAIFAIVWLNASPIFSGFGGGLGTTACISVVITLGIVKALKPLKIL